MPLPDPAKALPLTTDNTVGFMRHHKIQSALMLPDLASEVVLKQACANAAYEFA